MKKKIISILLSMTLLVLAACGNKQAENTEPAIEVARNDWYGAILRMDKLDTDAKTVVSVLDNKNYEIITGNPQDYWSDGYYHFTFAPLESPFINFTLYLNESDAWEDIVANTTEYILNKKPDATDFIITRDNENEYSMQWQGYDTFDITNETLYLTRKVHCLYDPSHNWAQLVESSYKYGDDTRYEEDLVEYAEINSKAYALQCSKSRLYTEYDDDGILVKMYYSKLGDEVRENKAELDMTEEFVVENVFDMGETLEAEHEPTAYETNPYVYNSEDDSIFGNINELGFDWVMSENTIDQYVIYENETLMFRVKNKLSGEYEGFIVSNVINEPVLNEEDGKYYDPVSGRETSMEEYNERLAKVKAQTETMENIIANEDNEEEYRKKILEFKPTVYDMHVESTDEESGIAELHVNGNKVHLIGTKDTFNENNEKATAEMYIADKAYIYTNLDKETAQQMQNFLNESSASEEALEDNQLANKITQSIKRNGLLISLDVDDDGSGMLSYDDINTFTEQLVTPNIADYKYQKFNQTMTYQKKEENSITKVTYHFNDGEITSVKYYIKQKDSKTDKVIETTTTLTIPESEDNIHLSKEMAYFIDNDLGISFEESLMMAFAALGNAIEESEEAGSSEE